MENNKDWGLRNCKEVNLADELVLDLLVRMRKKLPNDKDFGSEVSALLDRLQEGVEDKKVGLN